MPITSKLKGYQFELAFNFEQIKVAVLCDQVCSMDWKASKVTKIISLNELLIENILQIIQTPLILDSFQTKYFIINSFQQLFDIVYNLNSYTDHMIINNQEHFINGDQL